MKDQHFFYVSLGALLLIVPVAYGQAPIAEPEPGQPAPGLNPHRLTGSILSL